MRKGGCSGGDQGVSSRRVQGVQRPRTIACNDRFPGQEILHRATRRVKLDRIIIIRRKDPGRIAELVAMTGNREPLLTIIEGGIIDFGS